LESVKARYEDRSKALEAKELLITSLDKQIRKMQQKQSDLLALADKLEAKLQQLKLKQMENSVAVDNSKVAEAEELAKQIEKRLAEEDFKAEEYAKYGLTNATEPAKAEPKKNRDEVRKKTRELLGRDESKAEVSQN